LSFRECNAVSAGQSGLVGGDMTIAKIEPLPKFDLGIKLASENLRFSLTEETA
jgi:hypothetical protein